MRRDGYRVVRIRGGAKGWGAWPRLGGGAERAVDVGSLGKHQHKDTLDGRSINKTRPPKDFSHLFSFFLVDSSSNNFVVFCLVSLRFWYGTERACCLYGGACLFSFASRVERVQPVLPSFLFFFFLLRFNRFGTPQTQIQTKGAAMTKFRCYIYFKGFSALLRTMYLVLLGFIWLFIACVSKSKLPSFSDVSRVFEVQ